MCPRGHYHYAPRPEQFAGEECRWTRTPQLTLDGGQRVRVNRCGEPMRVVPLTVGPDRGIPQVPPLDVHAHETNRESTITATHRATATPKEKERKNPYPQFLL